MRILTVLVVPVLLLALVAACNKQEQAAAPSPEAIATASAQQEARAEQHYAMYEEMLKADNAELALPLGEELLKMYPDSAAAARIRADIEALRVKATTEGESRRLSRLWTYQTSPMAGGQQSTASIYNTEKGGAAGAQVRLVFRRHSDWGQSVFLYGNEPGFTCAKNCRVTMTFDGGSPTSMEGSIPPTGEPAIFIEEDKAFIAKAGKSKTVDIEVNEEGKPPRTLRYEMGGFDPDKFLPLERK